MVRLKEIAELTPFNAIVISIPYGAIKRHVCMKCYMYLQNFNSLWCD